MIVSYRKGFTLLELLVVIAIIGLLSSIVIASVSSARDKAKKTAALQFANSNHHYLGADSQLDVLFSENTGTTTFDGFNNATLYNGAAWTTDTVSEEGSAISFDGVNDYVQGSIDGSIFNGDFTVAAWFKHDAATQWGAVWSNSVGSNNTTLLTMRNLTTQFGMMRVGVAETGVYVDLGANHYGKWIYGGVTRTGSQITVFAYVDGVLLTSTGTLSWTLLNTNSYFVGRHWTGGHYFDGTIDEVRVYTENLELSQIDEIYHEQKSKYLASN